MAETRGGLIPHSPEDLARLRAIQPESPNPPSWEEEIERETGACVADSAAQILANRHNRPGASLMTMVAYGLRADWDRIKISAILVQLKPCFTNDINGSPFVAKTYTDIERIVASLVGGGGI